MEFKTILAFLVMVLAITLVYSGFKKIKQGKKLSNINVLILSATIGAITGLCGYQLLS